MFSVAGEEEELNLEATLNLLTDTDRAKREAAARVFSGTRAIVDACCEAWNRLLEEAGRIRSLTEIDWIRKVKT